MTDFDVVIVGAGIAGMSAVRTLKDNGLSVQILES
jgi:flavin-dependent dehydrogenase